LNHSPPTAVTDDSAGQHRGAAERVDVAERMQRAVIEPEQRCL
jgi:hypothetical protein